MLIEFRNWFQWYFFGDFMGRIWELVLILVIVFIFFGAGKLPNVMGDIGKSIRNFKDGLKGDKKPELEGEGKNKEEEKNN